MNHEPRRSWSESPPSPSVPSLLGIMRWRGRLRPRQIGCLLIVLAIPALWISDKAVNGVAALFRPHSPAVVGRPFDTTTPARPVRSGSPTIDRIVSRGKLIVAIQETPGLATRSPDSDSYTGFDIALLGLIARDLGVDPARTSFKPLAAGSREAALGRAEVDLVLGGHDSTAAPATSPVTEYGIGLPPGDPRLRERVTAVLRRAIDDGTCARLYAEYLGTPVPNPPVPR